MTTRGEWRRVTELFSAALDIESEKRPKFLDTACADSECELRRQVEALLAAHDESGDFLSNPAATIRMPADPSAAILAEGHSHVDSGIGIELAEH